MLGSQHQHRSRQIPRCCNNKIPVRFFQIRQADDQHGELHCWCTLLWGSGDCRESCVVEKVVYLRASYWGIDATTHCRPTLRSADVPRTGSVVCAKCVQEKCYFSQTSPCFVRKPESVLWLDIVLRGDFRILRPHMGKASELLLIFGYRSERRFFWESRGQDPSEWPCRVLPPNLGLNGGVRRYING